MGNSTSRLAHGLRDTVRACSGKRRRRGVQEDDEARLSTYESEPLDRGAWAAPGDCGGHERAVSVSRTGSRSSSLVRLHDGKLDPSVPACGRLVSLSPRLGARGSPRIQPRDFHGLYNHQHQQQNPSHTDPHFSVSYQPLSSAGWNSTGVVSASLSPCYCRRSRPWVVDQGSQTAGGKGQDEDLLLLENSLLPRVVEPVLSKEYIVKTYSIQNATPSPSPSTQTKFPGPNADSDTPSGSRTRQPRRVHEWTPSPPSTLERETSSSSTATCTTTSPQFTGPLASLEQRQEDVLKRLEAMRATVAGLEQKYKVKVNTHPPPSASTSSVATVGGASLPAFVGKAGHILDLAISADPSSVPLSLVALAEQISLQFPTLLSTFVHSSVASYNIPDRLQQLLRSNGSRNRADCQVAVTLVWKKVSHSPQLVVDPVHQTAIQGEANVARYLWALLARSQSDLDPARATLEDELLDLAQLQVLEGNNKERAAAVRKLNSTLGKQNSWLMGGDAPSLADVVCWSAVHQAGLVQGAPANVQRWLKACMQHQQFVTAQGLVDAAPKS